MISIIVAVSNHGVIGINNQLPWHLPADLKRFKTLTMGKALIMGRKTYESIGKPLPGRRNLIVSHHLNLNLPGCEVVNSLNDALMLAQDIINKKTTDQEVMIIGGAQLIEQSLPIANRLYVTYIHHDFEGDCFLPEFDKKQWREIEREEHQADEKNKYDYSFVVLERV